MPADIDPELVTVSVDPKENGAVFSLGRRTYRSLSVAALSVASEIMTVKKLRDGSPGVICEIYGRGLLVTIYVAGTVSIFTQGLDDTVALEVISEPDSNSGWSRVREKMKLILGGHERCD